jgi:hypothetical protein
MASIRKLKKDVLHLVGEIVYDTQLFILLNPKQNSGAGYSIIEDAIDMHNFMIFRANYPDGKHNPKIVKRYYKALRADLRSQAHSLFERISKLKY